MTEFLPGIEFNGVPELAPLWDAFTREYTQQGASQYNLKNAALLNQLAFGDGVEKLLAQHNPANTASAYKTLKERVEDVSKAISDLAENGATRPLNRTIIDKLITQWIELEKKHGLYPPPLISANEGVSAEEKRRILELRRILVKSPEGGLIAGALRMALANTIRAQTHAAYHRLRKRKEYYDVLVASYDIFDAALFAYEQQGASFPTYVQSSLEKSLINRVLRKSEDELISLDADKDQEKRPLKEVLEDKREARPLDNVIQGDLGRKIRAVVDKLHPRYREILILRFGLEDGITHTLDEVGQELGVTRERIRQLEAKAISSFKALYQGMYHEHLGDFFNRYFEPENAPKPRPAAPKKEHPHAAQRAFNPEGKQQNRSFGENLALADGLSFDRFLDDLLTERWKITPQEFRDCVVRNIERRLEQAKQEEDFDETSLPEAVQQYAKQKVTPDSSYEGFPEADIIQKWAEGRYPPRRNRPHVVLMAYAFALSPSQEHLLWKMIHGKPLTVEQVQAAIEKKDSGELGALLADASGITRRRLAEMLGVQSQAVNGWVDTVQPHHIHELEVAEQFASLLTSHVQWGDQPHDPEHIASQRRRIMEIMTGRRLEHLPHSPEDASTQFKALLEESFEKGHSFNEFINAVVKKWDVPWSYLNFINVNNAERLTDYQPMHKHTFWSWGSRSERPWWPTIEKIVTGTGMNVAQELKLWKMTYGQNVTAEDVRVAVAQGNSGKLLRLLLEGAGIGRKRMYYLLAIPDDILHSECYKPERSKQTSTSLFCDWLNEEKPVKIADLKKAERMADLLLTHIKWPENVPYRQEQDEAEILRAQVVEQLTGRNLAQSLHELTATALQDAKSYARLAKLLGKRVAGKRTDFANALGVTVGVLDDIMTGDRILSESEAMKLIKLAGGGNRDAVCQAVNVLTRTRSPSEMLADAEAGKVPIGALLTETRKRRRHSTEHVEEMTKVVTDRDPLPGINRSTIERFEGGSKAEHSTACRLAEYIGFEGEERRKFVVMARGYTLMPVTQIAHQRAEGTLTKREALHMLCNQTAQDEEIIAKLMRFRNKRQLHDYVIGKVKEIELSEKIVRTLVEWGGLDPQAPEMVELLSAFGVGVRGILHMVEKGEMDREKGLRKLMDAADISENELRNTYHLPVTLVKSIPKLLQHPVLATLLPIIAERTQMDAELTEKLQAIYDPQRAYADDGFVVQLERRRSSSANQAIGGA